MKSKNTFHDSIDGYVVGIDSRGREFYFDKVDYSLAIQHTWNVSASDGYVATNVGYKEGKSRRLLMHRFILNPKDNEFIDHKNRVRNDCRRENLRLCTRTENNRNTSKQINTTSMYKGVYWNKNKRKWHSRIMVNRKTIHLGYFDYEIDAAIAYNKASLKFYGEYATINAC